MSDDPNAVQSSDDNAQPDAPATDNMSHKMTVDAVVAAMEAQKAGLDRMIGMVKSMSGDVHGRWKTFLADHEAALHKWMRDEFGEGE